MPPLQARVPAVAALPTAAATSPPPPIVDTHFAHVLATRWMERARVARTSEGTSEGESDGEGEGEEAPMAGFPRPQAAPPVLAEADTRSGSGASSRRRRSSHNIRV